MPPETTSGRSNERRLTVHLDQPEAVFRGSSNGWLLALLAWILFVVYGSLVPLDFRALDLGVAWQRFLQTPMLALGVEQRADWLANGVLYVPVGFLSALVLMGEKAGTGRLLGRRLLGWLGAMALGMGLALLVEFCQLFFPQRTVSLNDLLAEGIGTFIGATLGWLGGPWLRVFASTLQSRWPAVVGSLLPAYGIALVLFSLFPFDLLLSTQELANKIQGPLWGWWLAPAEAGSGSLRAVARMLAEICLIVPLGWLWARRVRGASSMQAVLLGALLGLVLEAAQLLVASGVSQGVSVMARAAGWWLGNWLWTGRLTRPLPWWRAQGRRLVYPLAAAHLLALLALSGWFGSPLLGAQEALARISAEQIRFLPFYYHYFTTESRALASLTGVALLYAPLGLWLWLRGATHATVALPLAVGVATVVEIGKLFFQASRPDPTNVMVAAAAASLMLWGLQKLQQGLQQGLNSEGLPDSDRSSPTLSNGGSVARATSVPSLNPGEKPVNSLAPAGSMRWRLAHVALAGAVVAAAIWFANSSHEPSLWLGAWLLLVSIVVWWRPVWIFVLVPVAMALLDLAPWTGQRLFDEFDLLLLIGLAVAFVRVPPAMPTTHRQPTDRTLRLILWALALSLGLALLRGLKPWQGLDLAELGNPVGPWQALWVGKGALWAFGLAALAQRLQASGRSAEPAFCTGMVLALMGVALVVVWERIAFVGLWDWSTPYRVAGPFSTLNVGGAYIDAFLVVGLAFAAHASLYGGHWVPRVIALVAVL